MWSCGPGGWTTDRPGRCSKSVQVLITAPSRTEAQLAARTSSKNTTRRQRITGTRGLVNSAGSATGNLPATTDTSGVCKRSSGEKTLRPPLGQQPAHFPLKRAHSLVALSPSSNWSAAVTSGTKPKSLLCVHISAPARCSLPTLRHRQQAVGRRSCGAAVRCLWAP